MSPNIPEALVRAPHSPYDRSGSPRLTTELPQTAPGTGNIDVVSRTQQAPSLLLPHDIDEFQEFQSGGVHAETQTEDPVPKPFHEILGHEHWEHLLAHEADVTIGGLRAEDIRNLIPLLDKSGKKSNGEVDQYIGKMTGKAVIQGLQTFNPTQELMDAIIDLRKHILEWSNNPHDNTINATDAYYRRSNKSKPLTAERKKTEAYQCIRQAQIIDRRDLEQRFVKAYNDHETMLPPRGKPLRAYGAALAKA